MTNNKFWDFFNKEAAPDLVKSHRESTFRKIFSYLDAIDHPVTIVETGCARAKNSFATDGNSTILFDKYISLRDEHSRCYSVDISADAVANARALVSSRVSVIQDDSVHYLKTFADECVASNKSIDLLYLDSFDLDWVAWQPSAIHHLKELCASIKAVRADTLVVVDDCPFNLNFVPVANGHINYVGPPPIIGGKGRLIAEFAASIGATIQFAEYQAGWTDF